MGKFRRGGFGAESKINKKKRQFKAARLIVRNLPFTSTEENLKEHFSQFGKVAEVTLLRKGNKLVGCGFVQYESKAYAAAAIQKASGKEFLGRTIIADWAVSKDHFKKAQQQEIKKEIKEEPLDDIKEEIVSDAENADKLSVKEEPEDDDSEPEEIDVKSDSDKSSSDDEESDKSSDSEMDEDESDDEEKDSEDSDDEDEDEDDDSDEDDDEDDEDVKPDVKKIKKRKTNDVLEGKTVFIKNVPFLATEEELEKVVSKFGPVFYAKICMDQMTEHSKGTAFVKFKNKESADACLAAGTEFTLNGTILDPHPALPKKELMKKQSEPKTPSDSRNLYLLKEGVVMAGSKAAEGVSASDMAKRLQIERWKRQIIKDLGKFVSRYRLVIHNIPYYYDDKKVAILVKKYCPKYAKFREVRVMRDLKEVDSTGVGKSKGFAFVSFEKHEDALATLRTLNNNPSVFKPQRRPIVSFSVESRKALKIKENRLEKSKQPKQQPEVPTTVVKTEILDKEVLGNKKNKKRNKIKAEERVKHINTNDNSEKEKYTGAYATPGTKKFMNNLSTKRQALLHRKQLKKEKTKAKIAKKKLPRQKRKALKLENMTRPKKNKNEDKDFSKLVNKYREQITNSSERKKWFD